MLLGELPLPGYSPFAVATSTRGNNTQWFASLRGLDSILTGEYRCS